MTLHPVASLVLPAPRWRGPALFTAAAGLALLAGLAVYVVERGVWRGAWWPATAVGGIPGLGLLAPWLPSFVHPFAFSLLNAALRPPGAGGLYRACVAWWVVNVAFEVGQHPALGPMLASDLDGVVGTMGLARIASGFFRLGTFDMGDLAAITAGSVAAAWLLKRTSTQGDQDERLAPRR